MGGKSTLRTRQENKFWARVNKTEACWLWTAAKHSGGYGVFRTKCTKQEPIGTLIYAHRYSFELSKGPIPEGLHIDHLCRIPACVNPAHLEAVTPRTNWERGISKSAFRVKQTQCLYGHELSGENLYLRPDDGTRQCLICKRAYWQAWYAKKKANADQANSTR